MVDRKNNPNNSRTLELSIATIIKDLELLKFVTDHLKAKNICKNVVKKLPFIIKCVRDR